MSHNITMDSGNPFALHLSDWRSERAPPNINFCEIPSRILVPTMHTYYHIPVVHGQCWVQFSYITSVQWINLVSWWSSKTCTVFTCSWPARLKGVNSWWMSTHSWTLCTLSLNDAVSVQYHQTPALTGSEFQGWKCSAYINCHTTKFSARWSFHYRYHYK